MSKPLHSPSPLRRQPRPAGVTVLLWLVVMTAAALPPAEAPAETTGSPPLLVSARAGDTPAGLAQRYLNDPAKGWMIEEYNGLASFSEGQAVLIPTAPFRPGGLTPKGYQTIPVLAYGSIEEAPGKGGRISRSTFEEQMGWLRNGGFTAITPTQLIDFMDFSGQVPQRSILITVDTEDRPFLDLAVPILREFGFTATLFVATDRVGRAGAMTWNELQRLQEAGFAIGCRGRTSTSLADRAPGQPFDAYFSALATDLQQARKAIDRHLQPSSALLAYPSGSGGDLLPAMAAKIGYAAVFVDSPGENPFFGGRYSIHRRVVDRRLDPEQFNELLTTRIMVDLAP